MMTIKHQKIVEVPTILAIGIGEVVIGVAEIGEVAIGVVAEISVEVEVDLGD